MQQKAFHVYRDTFKLFEDLVLLYNCIRIVSLTLLDYTFEDRKMPSWYFIWDAGRMWDISSFPTRFEVLIEFEQ